MCQTNLKNLVELFAPIFFNAGFGTGVWRPKRAGLEKRALALARDDDGVPARARDAAAVPLGSRAAHATQVALARRRAAWVDPTRPTAVRTRSAIRGRHTHVGIKPCEETVAINDARKGRLEHLIKEAGITKLNWQARGV